MRPLRDFCSLLTLALLFVAAFNIHARAQSGNAPRPVVDPETQDQIKITTEEVRLPVFAYDEFGRFDPTLSPDDILVLEDDVPQQVRSVRHIPSHIVLLLDTGGDATGPHGLSKSTSLTRAVAQQIVRQMKPDDQVAVIQVNERVETVQPWTADKQAALTTLQRKLIGTKRSRLMEGLAAAAQILSDRPEGSRHVVLVTDGVEAPDAKMTRAEAVAQLLEARATVHVVSYTEYVRQKPAAKKDANQTTEADMDRERLRAIRMAGIDPTMPPGQSRGTFGGGAGGGVRFDPAMRRARKEYENKVKKSQETLIKLAQETGGNIVLPKSDQEMIDAGNEVARDVGAQYIVTYRPKRPLAEAKSGEYRRVAVAPRKTSLKLRARQGYVVP